MKENAKEEVIRMIKHGNNIYFHQEDICRILEIINKMCETLHAKSLIEDLTGIFSCTVDDSEK